MTASVGGAGLNHDDSHAWSGQARHEILHRLGREELALGAVVGDQALRAANRAVVNGHLESVAGEVAGKVGTHHAEACDADVCDRCWGGESHVAPSGGLRV